MTEVIVKTCQYCGRNVQHTVEGWLDAEGYASCPDAPQDVEVHWPEFDVEELVESNMAQIAKNGFVTTGIFDPDNQDFPWAYSTGFTVTLDHPEVVIYGLPVTTAHSCMWSAHHAIKGGARLEPGTYSDDILHNYRVAIVKVDEVMDPLYTMRMSARILGSPFEAVQIVWPDKQGRFPWNGASTRQRLFGTWKDKSAD